MPKTLVKPAGEVIEAWAEEGYSLRHGIVEALNTSKKENLRQVEMISIVEQLQGLIYSLDNQQITKMAETGLSKTFKNAMKTSVKLGISME